MITLGSIVDVYSPLELSFAYHVPPPSEINGPHEPQMIRWEMKSMKEQN